MVNRSIFIFVYVSIVSKLEANVSNVVNLSEI